MRWFQLAGLSGVLVSFAIISGGYASAAATTMDDNETTATMGGAPIYSSKNTIQNAVNSKDHTTLVAAAKAGDLVDTLSGAGSFAVFALTSEASAALPADTVDKLLKPESKPILVKALTYHAVPGRLMVQDLMKAVADGGGKAMLKIVEGDPLTVTQEGDHLAVTDDKDEATMVTIGNVHRPNGMIHVVDKVLIP